jgi:transposase
VAAATRGAVRFPRRGIAPLTDAIHWRSEAPRGELTIDHRERQRAAFDDRLLDLVCRPRAVPE